MFFSLPCCPRARAQSLPQQGGVEGSTAPVSRAGEADQGNLMLNFSRNSGYSRVGLDYSIRWDFSDVSSFRSGLNVITSGVKAISSWDITKNTRLNYYGFKTNPWKVILADEGQDRKGDAAAGRGAAGQAGGGVVNRAAPDSHKHLRLSISPLVDDFKLDFEKNLPEMLLRGSLNRVSPQWEKAGNEGRREFVKDVLSLGIWDVPLPGVNDSREGLEYLSDGQETGAGHKAGSSGDYPAEYKIRESTGPAAP